MFGLCSGLRQWEPWDVEVVLARFEPGSAFGDQDDDAWFGKLQIRYRF